MTEIPDLWWSETPGSAGVWSSPDGEHFYHPYWPCRREMPADAVELGDVEALRAEIDEARRILGAESDESLAFLAGTAIQRLDDVRLERDAAERERDTAVRVLAAHLDCVGNLERERDALRDELDRTRRTLNSERQSFDALNEELAETQEQLDTLRAEIQAVLDIDWLQIRPYVQFLEGKIGRIRAIVERTETDEGTRSRGQQRD